MTKFTAEEKLAAVQSYLEGVGGYDAVGASMGAAASTIRTWVIQYKHNGVEAFIKSYASYSAQFKLDVGYLCPSPRNGGIVNELLTKSL
ncbi:transposase [Bacillus toyonensis]